MPGPPAAPQLSLKPPCRLPPLMLPAVLALPQALQMATLQVLPQALQTVMLQVLLPRWLRLPLQALLRLRWL